MRTDDQAEHWCALKAETLRCELLAISTGQTVSVGVSWKDAAAAFIAAKRAELRPASIAAYEHVIGRCDTFGLTERTSTSSLTGPYLARLRDTIAALGIKAASRNHIITHLRTVILWARDRGYVPADRETISRSMTKVAADRERKEFLTPAECAALVKAALAKEAECHRFVLLGLLTGCRLSEILRLRHSDIEPENRRLHVNESKTRKYRTLDMDVMGEASVEWVCGLPDPLWSAPLKTMIRRVRQWQKKVPVPKWSPQRLRVTCATMLCATAGAYRESRQLGHGIAEAERSYVGLAPRNVKDGMPLDAAMGLFVGGGKVSE